MNAGKPQHPSRAELIALSIGELPAQRAEEVREHLLDCDEDCLAQVRELLRLPEAPPSPELEVSDEDQANAWQRLQARIAEDDRPPEALAPVVSFPTAPKTAAPVRNRFRELAGLLAAASLGIVIGGQLLGGDDDFELKPQPQYVQFSSTELVLRGTGPETEIKELKCADPDGDFVFGISFDSEIPPRVVFVRIISDSRKIVAATRRFETDAAGGLSFLVPTSRLPSGKYLVIIQRETKDAAEEEKPFSVKCPK